MPTFNFDNPAPQHNPFKVPSGYFEQFADSFMQKIAPKEKVTRELPFIKWIPLSGAACIAALALFFSQMTPISTLKETSSAKVELQGASYEDAIYDYLLMAETDDFSSYDSEY